MKIAFKLQIIEGRSLSGYPLTVNRHIFSKGQRIDMLEGWKLKD